MPKGVGEPGGFFMGLCPLIPLVCYFSLLRQRKVTKRKASPTRTAVLSGRHVDAGFGAWPPPTLRAWPAPDGARASHERAPALRSVPPAVLLMRIATLAHRGRLRRSSALYPPSAFRHHLFCSAICILIIQTRVKYLIVNIQTSCVWNTAAGAHPSCGSAPAPISTAIGAPRARAKRLALTNRRRHQFRAPKAHSTPAGGTDRSVGRAF